MSEPQSRNPPGAATPDANSQEIPRERLKTTLGHAIEHARIAQRHVAVLMVALARDDRRDAIFGVPTTEIMRRALKRLPAALRPADRFVQLSDEKICVILPNLKSDAQAWLAGGKIQRVLEEPYSFDDSLATVRPVVGIASFPEQADSAEQLVVRADIAKRMARSRDVAQHVFQNEDQRETGAYLGLEGPLREAIRNNLLEVHYQPQINIKTGACQAVEGLLRWTRPEQGPIAPPAIVRIAEANGMIGQLTVWVLNTVLRNQAEWKRQGVSLHAGMNLSTVTLTDTSLPDVITQAMGTWGADPAMLTLEITETATIGDAGQSLAIMNRLKKTGIRLSVDDFGTGYSSLSYVKTFPLDELKIDKLFVQHMRASKGDQQIVRSVIDLAHNFELTVVAEGVEDEATFKDLKKMGCDLVQGFYFSPALPSTELLAWLPRRR